METNEIPNYRANLRIFSTVVRIENLQADFVLELSPVVLLIVLYRGKDNAISLSYKCPCTSCNQWFC